MTLAYIAKRKQRRAAKIFLCQVQCLSRVTIWVSRLRSFAVISILVCGRLRSSGRPFPHAVALALTELCCAISLKSLVNTRATPSQFYRCSARQAHSLSAPLSRHWLFLYCIVPNLVGSDVDRGLCECLNKWLVHQVIDTLGTFVGSINCHLLFTVRLKTTGDRTDRRRPQ